MLICKYRAAFSQSDAMDDEDWSAPGAAYSNLLEMPSVTPFLLGYRFTSDSSR